MSLTSIFFSNKKSSGNVDEGLDEIFKSSAGPSSLTLPSHVSDPPNKKRKSEGDKEEKSKKLPRKSQTSHDVGVVQKASGVHEAKRTKKHGSISSTRDLEATAADPVDVQESEGTTQEDSEPSDSDEDRPLPVHESLGKSKHNKKKESTKKKKYVPDDETREERDARSIFVGNLPVQIVKDRPLGKQLRRHILAHVPNAKIESVRFRSVAFQNPTTSLTLSEKESVENPSVKQQRAQKRAAEWRASGQTTADKEEEEEKKGSKSYLTPAQKRRLAAIKGELHEHATAAANAYIVFAHPLPKTSATEDSTHGAREVVPVLDPFEAARKAVQECDGTTFAERTIRVDHIGLKKSIGDRAESQTEPKLSIFVGNLDFASGEDDLRAFFEKLMCEERGLPEGKEKTTKVVNEEEDTSSEVDSDDEEDREGKDKQKQKDDKKLTWVTRVRVVRDRDTQLGKGFAFVQFQDRECVDEIFALEESKLKFAKRKLRIQRCSSNLSHTKLSKKTGDADSRIRKPSTSSKPNPRSQPILKPTEAPVIPKGDPTLGARLAGLSKETRKQAKAADAARVARRLAKKKARGALEKSGIKQKGLDKEGSGKMRMRQRKDKKDPANIGKKTGKKRVRSERNIDRQNTKK